MRSKGDSGINYSVYIKEDGKSFMHFVQIQDGSKNIIPDLESFQKFREALKLGTETPPNSDNMDLIDSSWDIF